MFVLLKFMLFTHETERLRLGFVVISKYQKYIELSVKSRSKTNRACRLNLMYLSNTRVFRNRAAVCASLTGTSPCAVDTTCIHEKVYTGLSPRFV